MSALQFIAGSFGIGQGRYSQGVFACPGKTKCGIESVASVQVDASLARKDWGQALANGVGAGGAVAALGILAAPFAAVVLPFGLTLGAIAAGIALFNSGASAASIIHVAFHDGCYFVALADEELGSALLSTITTCAFRWEIAAGRSLTSRLRLSDRVPGGSDARVERSSTR